MGDQFHYTSSFLERRAGETRIPVHKIPGRTVPLRVLIVCGPFSSGAEFRFRDGRLRNVKTLLEMAGIEVTMKEGKTPNRVEFFKVVRSQARLEQEGSSAINCEQELLLLHAVESIFVFDRPRGDDAHNDRAASEAATKVLEALGVLACARN